MDLSKIVGNAFFPWKKVVVASPCVPTPLHKLHVFSLWFFAHRLRSSLIDLFFFYKYYWTHSCAGECRQRRVEYSGESLPLLLYSADKKLFTKVEIGWSPKCIRIRHIAWSASFLGLDSWGVSTSGWGSGLIGLECANAQNSYCEGVSGDESRGVLYESWGL